MGIKIDSLKKKLLILSLIPIIVMSVMVIGVLVFNSILIARHKEILDQMYFYRNLSTAFEELDSNFSIILPNTYNEERVHAWLEELDKLSNSLEPYIIAARGTRSWSSIRGLGNMLSTYREQTQHFCELLKRNESYYEEFRYARTVGEFILKRIDSVLSDHVHESSGLYNRLQRYSENFRIMLIVTFSCFFFGLLWFVLRLSESISNPIKSLSKKARRMAQGELDLPEEVVHTNDEVATLAESFNEMVHKIRLLIQKIVAQTELEKRLKEEEMRNLANINFIREAELKNLKSQINPHFLFNTLNTISKMALIEDAAKTNSLIQSTSQLLRYNLKNEDTGSVHLSDEIANISEYMKIYKIRFQDKFTYTIKTDVTRMDMEVPFLMLQPLVENAIIHGIEPKSGKSLLAINVFEETIQNERFVCIEIVDDGVGIDPDTLKTVMSGERAGLGIYNVKKRIEYFYDRDDLFSIESIPSGGTRIHIDLPSERIHDEHYRNGSNMASLPPQMVIGLKSPSAPMQG